MLCSLASTEVAMWAKLQDDQAGTEFKFGIELVKDRAWGQTPGEILATNFGRGKTPDPTRT